MGSYLLTGDELTMTSGPRMGKRYHRISDRFVRLLDARGEESDLRCIRQTRNND